MTHLNDPRIQEAKKLLIETVREHATALTSIRPPQKERVVPYQELIDAYGAARGAPLYYPFLGSGLGNGALVELLDGSVKYDFITGIGVHYFGHCHKALLSAQIDAACENTPMQTNLQQNYDAADLALLLTETAQKDHCFFCPTGVLANENALKIAFQKRSPASRILAFSNNFSGRTWAFSQITDKPAYRVGVPPNVQVDYLPFCDLDRTLIRLKEYLARYPGEYAAMIVELVQGEGGFYHGSKAFFRPLMEELKKEGVLIIADEVQTFGRTPSLFATHFYELGDLIDIITIGKLSQICATLYNKELQPQPGLLAQTFTGSTTAIKTSKVIIETLLQEDFYGPEGRIQKIHNHFKAGFEATAKRHPKLIAGPYGIGGMVAFTPLDGSPDNVMKFIRTLYNNGVMAFIAGKNPMRCRFLLPVGAVTLDDIDTVLQIVEETLIQCS